MPRSLFSNGSMKEIKEYIKKNGVNNLSDEYYETYPLYEAVVFCKDERKAVKVVRFLLKNGADVNAANELAANGNTALHRAIENKYVECVKLLLIYGADVNKMNDSRETPFHYCMMYKLGYNMMLMFINYGANINLKDYDGNNALDYCHPIGRRYKEAEHLIDMGIDIKMIEEGEEDFDNDRYVTLQILSLDRIKCIGKVLRKANMIDDIIQLVINYAMF